MQSFEQSSSPLPEDADPAQGNSPLFLQTIQDISQRVGLDAQKIAAGEAIEFKGVVFWLGHHGATDPDGLVVYIHMGEIAAGFEPMIFRRMLERNAVVSGAVSGYYALFPGSNTAAFCVRLNMAKAASPADAVLAYVGLFAAQVEELDKLVRDGMQMAREEIAREEAGTQGNASAD